MFGRAAPSKKPGYPLLEFICIVLFCITIVFFARGAFLGWTGGSVDNWLKRIYPIDSQAVSSLAAVKELVTEKLSAVDSENLFTTFLTPLQHPQGVMLNLAEQLFPQQINLLRELSSFEKDLYSLFGFKSPQTYLIVLQNVAEKRPNGGFFGSFGILTLNQGKLQSFAISDSYYPEYDRPRAKILGPDRLEKFLPDRDIYFVGANKVGFTYQDGAHIKTLYEKSYPGKQIRGVIFLRTDMFESLIQGFSEQLRHRQYVNATIDLIRGEASRGKKQLYLSSLQDFLKEHKKELFTELVTQLPGLIDRRMINIYLENISPAMHTWLRTRNLTTRFEENHAYFRDSNIQFNKIDRFVKKSITLRDDQQKIVANWSGDIVPLPALTTGKNYTFAVTYTLNVPEAYHQFIREMNQQYHITLTAREEGILGLNHIWATRGVVYLPKNTEIVDITGAVGMHELFETPFSHNVMYTSKIEGNNRTNEINVQFKVK